MLVRPMVMAGGISPVMINPGDLVAGSENILGGNLTTAGAGTWTAAMIANGIIRRTGPVGGYTDTTDTAASIIAALAGPDYSPESVKGTTFRMRFINTVAQAMTFAAGTGVTAGTGTLNCAASLCRDYLFTILNAQPVVIGQFSTVNGSAVVTAILPSGRTGLSEPPATQNYYTNGALVTGTGIPAATTILGVTRGPGGVVSLTLSANATADAPSGVALTIGPNIQIDSLGTAGL